MVCISGTMERPRRYWLPYYSVILCFWIRRHFGNGLGAGIQKLHYLPTPHTDFIFSIIGEELGLIGTITIVLLFMIFVWRGIIYILYQFQDRFGKLLAFGIFLLNWNPSIYKHGGRNWHIANKRAYTAIHKLWGIIVIGVFSFNRNIA